MNKSLLSLAAIFSAYTASCATVDGDELVDEADQDLTGINGTSLNGTAMSGTTPTGGSLAGTTLVSLSITGTSQTGATITAGSTTAPPLTTASIVNSTWNGTASNGVAVKLRIDSALAGTGANADLWFYAFSYQTSTGWSPVCGLDGASQPIKAVTVAGVWSATTADAASYAANATKFTIACRTKTIAKCVEFGYKSFKGYTNQMMSCVRMLRGDFCGTGMGYTVDGTTVNVYDNIGILADSQAWPQEAEWTPTGARCVNTNNAARYQLAMDHDPKCIKQLKTTTCGASFASGAVLIDEYVP